MNKKQRQPKALHEAFAQFFEQPSREALRKLLQDNLGEFDNLDFKKEWPDRTKLAKHILSFANSSGGVLIVGVAERSDKSLNNQGVNALIDKTDIHNSVRKYLPDSIKFTVFDFTFNETEYAPIKGKQFQVLLVEDIPSHLPFISTANGDGIAAGMVYVRDGVSTSIANQHQIQEIINRRLETGNSTRREMTLSDHFDDLKILYSLLEKRMSNPMFASAFASNFVAFSDALSVPNPFYPQEDYETFVNRMIEDKKTIIRHFLTG